MRYRNRVPAGGEGGRASAEPGEGQWSAPPALLEAGREQSLGAGGLRWGEGLRTLNGFYPHSVRESEIPKGNAHPEKLTACEMGTRSSGACSPWGNSALGTGVGWQGGGKPCSDALPAEHPSPHRCWRCPCSPPLQGAELHRERVTSGEILQTFINLVTQGNPQPLSRGP